MNWSCLWAVLLRLVEVLLVNHKTIHHKIVALSANVKLFVSGLILLAAMLVVCREWQCSLLVCPDWHISKTVGWIEIFFFSSAADFHCLPSTAFQLNAHTTPFCWNPSPKTLALSLFMTAIQISTEANLSGPFPLTLLELEHRHLRTILLMGVTHWSFAFSFLSHFGKTALSQIPFLTHIDREIKQNELQHWKYVHRHGLEREKLCCLNWTKPLSLTWHWWRAGVERHWPVQVS